MSPKPLPQRSVADRIGPRSMSEPATTPNDRTGHGQNGWSDGNTARYHCRGAAINHGSSQPCISFGFLRVDQAVAAQVLSALRPLGIRAALQAIDRQADDDQVKRRQLELALEQLRFEAARAQRQFDVVDPGNRLVAGELERRWNERLAQVASKQSELDAYDARPQVSLSSQQRDALLRLGADLPLAWHDPAASNEVRKRILRSVINEIVVRVAETEIQMVIHWQGGDHTAVGVPKNRVGQHRWTTPANVQELIAQLARQLNDAGIAALLNRLGHRTGKGHTWTEMRVRSFRNDRGVAVYREGEREERGEITLEQAARLLEVSAMTVLRMIATGAIAATQACRGAPWVIARSELDRPELRSVVVPKRRVPLTPDPNQIPLELQ